MKRSTKQTEVEVEVETAPEIQPVDHVKEIGILARQLNNDQSPSGAQSIGGQIMSHLNAMDSDERMSERKHGRT